MDTALLLTGALLTLVGAALLTTAFRHGRAGRAAQERRAFVLAVAAMATGSASLAVGVILGS
ncbi:MAG TPA: hypothetical protein VGK35_08490 [Actinotalea sp.]